MIAYDLGILLEDAAFERERRGEDATPCYKLAAALYRHCMRSKSRVRLARLAEKGLGITKNVGFSKLLYASVYANDRRSMLGMEALLRFATLTDNETVKIRLLTFVCENAREDFLSFYACQSLKQIRTNL